MTPHPLTLKSIELRPRSTDGTRPCGCHYCGCGLRLCQYHQGYDDGVEAAVTPELLDAIEALADYACGQTLEWTPERIEMARAWVTSMRSKP